MRRLSRGSELKKSLSIGKTGSFPLKVAIRCGTLEATFEGSAEEVLKAVLHFIKEVYPNYEIVSGLTLTVDLKELLTKLRGLIAFLPDGRPVILKSLDMLSDGEVILLYLLSAYIGSHIGKAEDDHLSIGELLDRTGKPAGTVAGRLSELVRKLCVDRVGRGEYKVTSYGVKKFMEDVLPKLEGAK